MHQGRGEFALAVGGERQARFDVLGNQLLGAARIACCLRLSDGKASVPSRGLVVYEYARKGSKIGLGIELDERAANKYRKAGEPFFDQPA